MIGKTLGRFGRRGLCAWKHSRLVRAARGAVAWKDYLNRLIEPLTKYQVLVRLS